MGNPESKPKSNENYYLKTSPLNTISSSFSNSNCKANSSQKDIFRRFRNYKKPYAYDKKITNDNTTSSNSLKIKKRKPYLKEIIKSNEKKLIISNAIMSNLLNEHFNKDTNLNFLLVNNINSIPNVTITQNTAECIKEMCKTLNAYSQNDSLNMKRIKKIDFYKNNNCEVVEMFEKYNEEYNCQMKKLEENLRMNEIRKNNEINENNKITTNTSNSNSSLENSKNEIKNKKEIPLNNEISKSKDVSFEFMTNTSNLVDSKNFNTTANTTKGSREMKVIRIAAKKENMKRSNSNSKAETVNKDPEINRVSKIMNHSLKNLSKSPSRKPVVTATNAITKTESNINRLSTSPSNYKRDRSPILARDKSKDKLNKSPIATVTTNHTDTHTNTHTNTHPNSHSNTNTHTEAQPRKMVKIDLRKKGNSLFESSENTNLKIKTENFNTEPDNKNKIIYKKKINSSASPKAFVISSSKNASLSTINVENTSYNTTYISIGDSLKPTNENNPAVKQGSYVELAKQKNNPLSRNTSKSPLKNSNTSNVHKIPIDSGRTLSMNKSSGCLFDTAKKTDHKNDTLNISSTSSSKDKKNSNVMFKIDLSKKDEDNNKGDKDFYGSAVNNFNSEGKKDNTSSQEQTPSGKKIYMKPPINRNLEKLNKLKNLKSNIVKINKNSNENEYSPAYNSENNTIRESLQMITESASRENDERDYNDYSDNRVSLQRRQTPKFDVLDKNKRSTSLEGDRFSFNMFNINKPSEPKIKLNFNINEDIDECDFKDVEALDNEGSNDLTMSIAQLNESDFELSYRGMK